MLIALGLLISVAAAASAISDARQNASLLDPGENPDQPGLGFNPLIVSEAQPIAQWAAPTMLPQTSSLLQDLQATSPVSTIPASPRINWQDASAGEGPLQTATATAPPTPTATAVPIWLPDRIVIPAINLDAPVKLAILNNIKLQGKSYQQWVPPNSFAAGRLSTSASLGVAGNTVFIGHHNVYGEVFRRLVDLRVGDLILVYSGGKEFAYGITLRMILPERDQPLDVRLRNAQWIAPSQDERLTLVTCWPYQSNTHRLIIVATPLNPGAIEKSRLIVRPTSRSINP